MPTHLPTPLGPTESTRSSRALPTAVQKVVIVNGRPDVLGMVEGVLKAGHYDVVFIESVAHAYSHVKRVQPNLVILCLRLDDPDVLQVLSMLKLDPETSHIPVMTYTAEYEGPEGEAEENPDEEEEEADESAVEGFFGAVAGLRMN